MSFRAPEEPTDGPAPSPDFEAIVSADTLSLLAIRSIPLAPGAMVPARPEAATNAGEDILWRLASDRDRRRSALFRVARVAWAGTIHLQILAASAEDCDVCSMALVADARAAGIKADRIVLEINECEQVDDPAKLALATGQWRSLGFRTATRQFGGGLSGLAMLLRLEPDIVCLDGDWIRRVAVDSATRIIVAGVVNTCRELGCEVIADGVVSEKLSQVLQDLGVRSQSGPLFARPDWNLAWSGAKLP